MTIFLKNLKVKIFFPFIQNDWLFKKCCIEQATSLLGVQKKQIATKNTEKKKIENVIFELHVPPNQELNSLVSPLFAASCFAGASTCLEVDINKVISDSGGRAFSPTMEGERRPLWHQKGMINKSAPQTYKNITKVILHSFSMSRCSNFKEICDLVMRLENIRSEVNCATLWNF